MTRIRLFTVVALWSAATCTDAPEAVLIRGIDPQSPTQPAASTAMIGGRIRVTGDSAVRVVEIRDVDSDVFRLSGNVSSALASLDGGDVVVWGTFDASAGFVVQEFTVTGMYGRPALDGVLEASEDGFALRLTDGSARVVPGLDSGCQKYIGARLWVIGWDEAAAVAFGLIAAL